MKIALVSNQPERTTRLVLFGSTLRDLGHEVVMPSFTSRNWAKIASELSLFLEKERPYAVHLFNVPDIIYRSLPGQKGRFYQKLIYDYRSPWGLEIALSFGWPARMAGERYERMLAKSSDVITSVNRPLAKLVAMYPEGSDKPQHIIPNYPPKSFVDRGLMLSSKAKSKAISKTDDSKRPVLFVGRISKEEGIGNLLGLVRRFPNRKFWIVGDGPLARWYLRRLPQNLEFYGWQPHDRLAELMVEAGLCLLPAGETPVTPYATENSVWKLNEYLNLGKLVLASGITVEEGRKNLVVTRTSRLGDEMERIIDRAPESMLPEDYRFWEMNRRKIEAVYEEVM
jgi:glycosyltransferase involved in cell wall biosynthesis